MITKRAALRKLKRLRKLEATFTDAIARIKWIAADRRTRVLKDDQLKWMEVKMREINRLAKVFPVKAWKPKRAKL